MDKAFTLDDQELGVIRNFVAVIDDEGVQSALFMQLTSVYGEGATSAKALLVAIKDLTETCGSNGKGTVAKPRDVVESAPSFAVVVHTARAAYAPILQLPDDFLPSTELVQKCLSRFYDMVRAIAE